jgi:predicted DNA-binding transcriptional regulator YafY
VDVYGLVAKAGAWYVVMGGEDPGQVARVVRVADVIDARLGDTHFTRPPDFDLAACWEAWRATVEAHRPVYPVTLRVDPGLLPYLRGVFGAQVDMAEVGPPDTSGWRTVTLAFESLPEARSVVLGFGRAVEVIEPEALRLSVIDYARQIAAFYAERAGDG